MRWFVWEMAFRGGLRGISWAFGFFVACTVVVDLIPVPTSGSGFVTTGSGSTPPS